MRFTLDNPLRVDPLGVLFKVGHGVPFGNGSCGYKPVDERVQEVGVDVPALEGTRQVGRGQPRDHRQEAPHQTVVEQGDPVRVEHSAHRRLVYALPSKIRFS